MRAPGPAAAACAIAHSDALDEALRCGQTEAVTRFPYAQAPAHTPPHGAACNPSLPGVACKRCAKSLACKRPPHGACKVHAACMQRACNVRARCACKVHALQVFAAEPSIVACISHESCVHLPETIKARNVAPKYSQGSRGTPRSCRSLPVRLVVGWREGYATQGDPSSGAIHTATTSWPSPLNVSLRAFTSVTSGQPQKPSIPPLRHSLPVPPSPPLELPFQTPPLLASHADSSSAPNHPDHDSSDASTSASTSASQLLASSALRLLSLKLQGRPVSLTRLVIGAEFATTTVGPQAARPVATARHDTLRHATPRRATPSALKALA